MVVVCWGRWVSVRWCAGGAWLGGFQVVCWGG